MALLYSLPWISVIFVCRIYRINTRAVIMCTVIRLVTIILFCTIILFVSGLVILNANPVILNWKDTLNYSYVSVLNRIFIALHVALNWFCSVLFYYATNSNEFANEYTAVNQHLDTARESDYGSMHPTSRSNNNHELAPDTSFNRVKSREEIPTNQVRASTRRLIKTAKDCVHYETLDCDYNGLHHVIKDHNITVRIPKGAMAEGEKVHFEVGVAMYGPLIFPENTQPISPILWFYASEDVRMNEWFQLTLPHCYTGSVIPPEQISFAIADQNSTEIIDGQAHFLFELWRRGTKFFYTKMYGEIQTDFCNHIFCIVKHTNYGHWCQDLSFLLASVDLQPSQTVQEFHFYGLFNITTNRIVLARNLQENSQIITSLTPFKFEDVKGSQPLIKLVPLTMNRIILLHPPAGEIKAHDIKYWRSNYNESKKNRTDMPIVRMQVFHTGPEQSFPIKFIGCTSDSNLEYHLILPADACNEGQVKEELRSFSSSGPTDLSPNKFIMEYEQPGDLQQIISRPSDLVLEYMDEGASINTNLEGYSDLRHVHQTGYFSAAEKTAHVPFLDHQMLEVDCNGREYTNMDHDITLRIPEGAVAEGEKVHFEVAVTMHGPFKFPENAKLVSPILWLCLLEEAAKLRKPLEIVLPHYLTGNIQQYNIGFLKANHNDYEMNDSFQMFYNFRPLILDTVLVYREGQGYAVTATDHLCYLCLGAQENAPRITENTNYCLTRVESHSSESLQEITFCASFLLPTCIKALQEQYPSSTIQYSSPFRFKEPQGSLKIIVERFSDKYQIAMDPSNAEIKASKIDFTPLSSLEINLMHELQTYPPRVKMSVDKISLDRFVIFVKIDGSAEDGQLNTELLFRPEVLSPHSPNSASSFESAHSGFSLQASNNSVLPWTTQSHLIRYQNSEINLTINNAFRATLSVAAEWQNIGTLLNIPDGTLSRIKHDEGGNGANSCLRVMLTEWLRKIDPPPTWSELADAVEPFNESKAEDIRTKFLANK